MLSCWECPADREHCKLVRFFEKDSVCLRDAESGSGNAATEFRLRIAPNRKTVRNLTPAKIAVAVVRLRNNVGRAVAATRSENGWHGPGKTTLFLRRLCPTSWRSTPIRSPVRLNKNRYPTDRMQFRGRLLGREQMPVAAVVQSPAAPRTKVLQK